MHKRSRFRAFGYLGLFAMVGSLGAAARAQEPAATRREGRTAGTGAAVARENAMLIAHGLEMAINACTLEALARQSDKGGNDRAVETLRKRAADDFATSDRLLRQAGQIQGQQNRGRAEGAGEAKGVEGRGGEPNGRPADRLYFLANEYAGMLRRLGDEGRGPGVEPIEADGQDVALINHAVCEALDAFAIRQARSDDGSSAASRALADHASHTEQESEKVFAMYVGEQKEDAEKSAIQNLAGVGWEIAQALRHLGGAERR